jgi:hypothetical protein
MEDIIAPSHPACRDRWETNESTQETDETDETELGGRQMNRTVTVCKIVALMALAIVTIAQASGQKRMVTPQQASNPFGVAYFTNANTAGAPDGQLRFTNDGETGGNLEANIYVFDTSEEMLECCCIYLTPNQYAAVDINNDLTSKPLTGPPPIRGIIKVVSSAGASGACPASAAATAYTPLGGIRAWISQIQQVAVGTYSITESDLKDSDLSSTELTFLQTTCAEVLAEGSGKAGACSTADSGQ